MHECGSGPGKPEAGRFGFITDDELRQILTRDDHEAEACMGSGAFKAAIVLTGSIVEALLLYGLRQTERVERGLESSDLAALIGRAKAGRLIGEDTVMGCDQIRAYRNLIHPGSELRRNQTPNKTRAHVARALLGLVTDDIRAATSPTGDRGL